MLDDTVIMSNIGAGGALSTSPDMVGNKAPVLNVEGPKSRTAKVGEAVALAAVATDDGKPNKRNMPAMLGGNYILPQTANGLRLSFFVYRGTGKAVTFEPPQTKVWEDTRDGGGSPWSAGWIVPPIPEGNRWQATRDVRRAGHLRHPRARARRGIVLVTGCDRRREQVGKFRAHARAAAGWWQVRGRCGEPAQ